MEVKEILNTILISDWFNVLFNGFHLREHISLHKARSKFPIQVDAYETGPMVTDDHPIRVHHGHDKEVERIQQPWLREEFIDDLLDCEAGTRLCWVSSR